MKLRQHTRLCWRLRERAVVAQQRHTGSHTRHCGAIPELGSSASKFLRCCGNNGRVCIALPLLLATIYSFTSVIQIVDLSARLCQLGCWITFFIFLFHGLSITIERFHVHLLGAQFLCLQKIGLDVLNEVLSLNERWGNRGRAHLLSPFSGTTIASSEMW